MTPTSQNEGVPSAAVNGQRLNATLAMLGSAACWGSATSLSKVALADFQPLTLLVVQLSASVVFLWLVVLIRRKPVKLDHPFICASLTGVLEPGLAYAVGLAGLALTTAANASLIFAAEPLLIVMLAWVILHDRPSWSLVSWMALAATGVVMVATADSKDAIGASVNALYGDGLILIGTACAALYVVLSSRMMANRDAVVLAAGQQTAGLVTALVILSGAIVFGVERIDASTVTLPSLAFAGVSGIVQYAMAFWLYLLGLKHLSAREAGLWLTFIPVFGVASAVLFLHETPNLATLLGAAVIITAVIGARR